MLSVALFDIRWHLHRRYTPHILGKRPGWLHARKLEVKVPIAHIELNKASLPAVLPTEPAWGNHCETITFVINAD